MTLVTDCFDLLQVCDFNPRATNPRWFFFAFNSAMANNSVLGYTGTLISQRETVTYNISFCFSVSTFCLKRCIFRDEGFHTRPRVFRFCSDAIIWRRSLLGFSPKLCFRGQRVYLTLLHVVLKASRLSSSLYYYIWKTIKILLFIFVKSFSAASA